MTPAEVLSDIKLHCVAFSTPDGKLVLLHRQDEFFAKVGMGSTIDEAYKALRGVDLMSSESEGYFGQRKALQMAFDDGLTSAEPDDLVEV